MLVAAETHDQLHDFSDGGMCVLVAKKVSFNVSLSYIEKDENVDKYSFSLHTKLKSLKSSLFVVDLLEIEL